jgi:hypothetical protein
MDPFGDFESKQENVEVDPAADFLAREQAELAKIENNAFGSDFDSFGLFYSQVFNYFNQNNFILINFLFY